MGWLIALAVLIGLAWLPIGADLRYDDRGFRLSVEVLKIPVWRRPGKQKLPKLPKLEKEKPVPEEPPEKFEKRSEPAKTRKSIKAPEQTPSAAAPKPQKGGSVKDFLPLIRLGLELLDSFRKKLRVDCLELNLILAGDDPCDLAMNYGRAWAALGNLIPKLEQYFVIKKRNLEVQCDFQAEEITVNAHCVLTVTLGRVLALAAVYGVRGLKEFLHLRKGGVQL